MRSPLIILVLTAAAGICLVGCAQPKSTTTLAPAEHEFPVIERPGRVSPVSVGVEGRRTEVRTVLVGDLDEPELTPEERAALGLDKQEPYNWLEFYVPPTRETRTWPATGGGDIGIGSSVAGPGSGVGGTRGGAGVGSNIGGVGSGVTGGKIARVSHAKRDARATSAAGTTSSKQVRVGEGGEKKTSGRASREER